MRRLVVRAAHVERQAMIEDDPVAELRLQRIVGLAVRGPQVLAAEESLNTGGARTPATTLKPIAAPAGWSGTQVYSAGGVTLVPFADAAVMRVWLPRWPSTAGE